MTLKVVPVWTSYKGRAIKGLVVCNNWDVSALGSTIKGRHCYQPFADVLNKYISKEKTEKNVYHKFIKSMTHSPKGHVTRKYYLPGLIINI